MEHYEIPDALTPIPEEDFILTSIKAWVKFYGQLPKPEQLACCLSQMVLETGRKPDPKKKGFYLWAKYAHNYNFGNIKSKSGDGNHWQYFDCGEEISLNKAQSLMKKVNGNLVTIKKKYTSSSGSKRASVWLRAPHQWCRFRAYETPLGGMLDYLKFLIRRKRYKTAWEQGAMQGDVERFSRELGKAGYYTADPNRYTKTMVKLFKEFEPKVVDVMNSDSVQKIKKQLEEAEEKNLMALAALTVDD